MPASALSLPRALVLGLMHGPAELLPVSSSAHAGLLLAGLGAEQRKEAEVALHAGALAALGLPHPAPALILTTLPPAVAGALLERPVERRLGGPRTMAAGLLAGGLALAAADAVPPRLAGPQLRPGQALALGVAQATALVPGVSRHGAALTALRAMGFSRRDSHALSREAARPVLLGATVLKGVRLLRRREAPAALAVAAAASAASTAVALRALGGRGSEAPLWPFAAYRAALAASVHLMSRGRADG
jgi:undecaprenyl-diphosphatase